MSSLWTPSGEVPLEPERGGPQPAPGSGPSGPAPAGGGGPGASGPPVSEEELAAVRELHDQIRATPAIDVVANHAVQLFELALVYLGVATPPDEQGRVPLPDLIGAGVAIDAMAALVDGLGDRFAEHEQTLRDALGQIQMLYVRVADELEHEGR